MFLFWACGGNRFPDVPREVERTAPWSELRLPDDGRTVSSGEEGLVVRYDQAEVGAIDRAWRGALESEGFAVVEDTSRGDLVSCSLARGEDGVALAISAIRGGVVVSLQELP